MTLIITSFYLTITKRKISSNTLKIEAQSVIIPPSEVSNGLRNKESNTEPNADHNGASISKEKYPTLDLVNDPAIVNIWNINESADPPLEEPVGVNLKDERSDTYKNWMQYH